MKCLSLRPVWAWAVIFGGKTIENRTWKTDYRGPLAIHASGSMQGADDAAAEVTRICGTEVPYTLDCGAVIGVVDLADCLDAAAPLKRADARWASRGCYHWVLRNPRPCRPFDVKGKLRLWDIPSTRIKLTS